MIYESSDFRIKSTDLGWEVTHKLSDGKTTVSYSILGKDASKEYLMGYALCLSYMKGWARM